MSTGNGTDHQDGRRRHHEKSRFGRGFSASRAQKYLKRSGITHVVAVTEYAYIFAKRFNMNVGLATRAALLHNIGLYTWYRDGERDYELYQANDIHESKERVVLMDC